MNLKERGITLGDLIIILAILITTTIVIKKLNNDNQSSLYLEQPETISLKR